MYGMPFFIESACGEVIFYPCVIEANVTCAELYGLDPVEQSVCVAADVTSFALREE